MVPRRETRRQVQFAALPPLPVPTGVAPADIELKLAIKPMKSNLVKWACEARIELNEKPDEIERIWAKTTLLEAWETKTIMEAARRAEELFRRPAGTARPGEVETAEHMEEDPSEGAAGLLEVRTERHERRARSPRATPQCVWPTEHHPVPHRARQ